MAFNENNELTNIKQFPYDANLIAHKILDLHNGKSVPELKELIEELVSKKYFIITTEIEELIQAIKTTPLSKDLKLILEKNDLVFNKIRSNLEETIIENSEIKNTFELTNLLNEVGLIYTKERIRRSSEKKDMLVIQAIEALNDLDKNINLYISRLREWYSLYFPELDQLVSNPETYTRIINKIGSKDNFTLEELEKIGLPLKRSELIFTSVKKSIGGELALEDLSPILSFSNMIEVQNNNRALLEKYIELLMEEVAPNIKRLVGANLGARLISLAGGLENLSKMPASTIQVLGAEKALFTSLKSGAPPPKHGVIFQHGWIHNAPKWQRGKIARALAGKLSIASRIDNFSSTVNENILVTLEKRINEIKKKYSEPPKYEKRKKPPLKRAKMGLYKKRKRRKNIV
jgi:nucleolar protein 56